MENLISDFEKLFISSKALSEAELRNAEKSESVPQPEGTVVPKQEIIEAGQDKDMFDLPVVDLEFKAELESAPATSGMF